MEEHHGFSMFSGGLSIAWAFFASSILSFELAMHAWTKRRNAYTNAFFAVMLCAGFWSMLSGMHLVVADFDLKVLVSSIKFLFVIPLPVIWILLAAWFTDFPISKRLTRAFFVLPVVSLALLATNDVHQLFFVSNTPFELEGFTTIERVYGQWFWVHTGYAYLMVMGAFLLFLRKVVTSNGYVRVQALIMMMGSMLPLLVNVAAAGQHSLLHGPRRIPVSGLDPRFLCGLRRLFLPGHVPVPDAGPDPDCAGADHQIHG